MTELNGTYLTDLQYTSSSFVSRSVHEVAEHYAIPPNISSKEKLTAVRRFNKQSKVKPPTLTKNSLRPDLSEIEIALIVTSYNTVPVATIAHILNVPERTVENTYNQYKHESLPQIPLIAITDTSRYLSEENLRYIYPATEFHNSNDPLTNKELLRKDILKSNKETEMDTSTCISYLNQRLQAGFSLYSPAGISRRIFPSKDFTDRCYQFYDRTWSDHFSSIFEKSILNDVTYYTIKNDSIKNQIPYTIKYNNKYDRPIYYIHHNYDILTSNTLSTHIANAYLETYKSTPMSQKLPQIEETIQTQGATYSIIPLLHATPNNLTYFVKDEPIMIKANHVTYTTNRNKHQNYKPIDNHLYLKYHVARPPIYDRCITSPLIDSNNNLRYTFPANTYKQLPSNTPDHKTIYPAIHCNNCQTFLSYHTTNTCKCKQVQITINFNKMQKRIFSNVKLKHLKVNINNLNPDLKDKVIKHLNPHTKTLTSKLTYAHGKTKHLKPNSQTQRELHQITPSTKYQHQFTLSNKAFIQVYQAPNADFSFHLYNHNKKMNNSHQMFNITPNILPLYTSFKFPQPNTSQEPYVT